MRRLVATLPSVILGAVGFLAFGMMTSVPARAGPTLTFELTQDGCTGGCGPGPYGSIVVSQNGSDQVSVTETLGGGAKFVNTGAGESLEFSLQGDPSITFSSLTTGFAVGPSPATASTFGKFDYSIGCVSCGSGGSNPNPGPLSFDIAAAGLTPESFIPSVDNQGHPTVYYFASDIINGNTGNVAALGGGVMMVAVAEPTSFAIMMIELLGIVIIRRKMV